MAVNGDNWKYRHKESECDASFWLLTDRHKTSLFSYVQTNTIHLLASSQQALTM